MMLTVFCQDIEYSDVLHHKDSYDTSKNVYAWSDSVNFVISSLQALLLGPAIGVDVDGIHIVTWSSV